ncbi:MAG: hypothetical protein WDZ27_05140 [Waddliaceae bacterium]
MSTTITLCGKLNSTLDWKQPLQTADRLLDKGKEIFWDLDLGLFDDLPLPLDNEMQYRSLSLSLSQFNEAVTPYLDISQGVLLCHGNEMDVDFEKKADFLSLFIPCVREELTPYLSLKFSLEALVYPTFQECRVIWREAPSFFDPTASTGILVTENKDPSFLIEMLQQQKQSFRLIPESFLTYQWEGLDKIFVLESGLSREGRRSLQGFIATEGEVVYI